MTCAVALAALARVWIPFPSALLAEAREVHPYAGLAARVAPMALVFEAAHDPEEVVSGLLDVV